MKTILLYPAETISSTLIRGGNKNPKRDLTLTPKRAKARRMRTAAKTATNPDTGIAYGVQSTLGNASAGYSDTPAAINEDGHAIRVFANTALGRESALWGARSPWLESAVWKESAKGKSALCGESALWGKALCGERRRRMQPVV